MKFLSKLVVALLKPLYYRFAAAMMRDTTWQEPLFDLMSPKLGERLLAFGPGSAATAIALAERFTELSIVVADPDPSIVRKSRRVIEKQQIPNVTFIDAPSIAALPVHTGCFDRAMCILSFHLRTPDEKIALAKEAFRILRRGGVFYVADYDRPTIREERIVLNIAAQISSRNAVQSHVDGTWGQLLKKAGFAGGKTQSSHSVRIGRIAVIFFRKP
ncbi:class I SAM-dependent methyltransferase [Bradyrhizobium sp. I71]|jgi:ubiquinone/menaquinone biosynthesis C-methylase UbiE|uniref:class I SAM-dependent methyltransferase n=1 Tax=Bradyrhizobium sp. I71 TaxID=2590772 RepID=UPI001EF7792E|nr:class I SAM-dependent methyltransferase [Bradyrhizobium sp. I71]ULL01619.1 class I SAM-dependent methyltransferase [Bradyrhizobium sp. I71]